MQSLHIENYNLTSLFLDRLESKPLENIFYNDVLHDYRSSAQNNLFIWIYSRSGCSLCTEREFLNIKKYSSQIGRENIAVIVTHSDHRELREALITYGLEDLRTIPVTDNERGNTIAKEKNNTIFFVLDSNHNANMIFYSASDLPSLTEKYFEKVTEKYFSRK